MWIARQIRKKVRAKNSYETPTSAALSAQQQQLADAKLSSASTEWIDDDNFKFTFTGKLYPFLLEFPPPVPVPVLSDPHWRSQPLSSSPLFVPHDCRHNPVTRPCGTTTTNTPLLHLTQFEKTALCKKKLISAIIWINNVSSGVLKSIHSKIAIIVGRSVGQRVGSNR